MELRWVWWRQNPMTSKATDAHATENGSLALGEAAAPPTGSDLRSRSGG